ncbi:MAG: glycosyltransferase [Ferruginibacter sp.]
MKVFISIPWFLPAYKAGGPIQSIANLINNLSDNIEYKIFCSIKDLNGEPLQNIITDEWIIYNSHTQVWYTSQKKCKQNLSKQLKETNADVLFIIGLFSWHFNIMPLLIATGYKKILSVRGMLHPGALSQKKWKKRFFVQALKLWGINKKVFFHATDDVENGFIKNQFGQNTKVFVANNFTKKVKKNEPLVKIENSLHIVTIALISPMKNHLLVLKALINCTANITYNIYGPIKDTTYWHNCLEQIKNLPKNIHVNYFGEIQPKEVEAVLAKNHLFIMPSKSENFGHAIAEALAAAKPVITSYNTPWVNLLENKAGINVATNKVEICTALNIFAKMNNDTYLQFVQGAENYSVIKSNSASKMEAYQKMFSV